MAKIVKHSNFWGRITTLETKDSVISISTSKEGFFKGLSTIISLGRYPNLTPFAKIIYEARCPSEGRYQSHQIFESSITVGLEEFNRDLKSAILTAVESLNSGYIPLALEIKIVLPIIKEVRFQK